uniref:Uncharacterized protein n=1 Tax=Bionectria ochroleuca TaxID=29856 RepID=A0A8H7K1B2_BIOOC
MVEKSTEREIVPAVAVNDELRVRYLRLSSGDGRCKPPLTASLWRIFTTAVVLRTSDLRKTATSVHAQTPLLAGISKPRPAGKQHEGREGSLNQAGIQGIFKSRPRLETESRTLDCSSGEISLVCQC